MRPLQLDLLDHAKCLLVAAALCMPCRATAAPAMETGDTRFEMHAELVIAAEALGEGGAPMEALLRDLEKEVLRDRGVGPAEGDGSPKIVLTIKPLSTPDRIFDHRIDISLEHGGQSISEPEWGFDCAECTDVFLFNTTAVVLHKVVTRLAEEDAKAAPGDDGGSAPRGVEAGSRTSTDAKSPRPGPLVWAGAGVTAAGVVGLATGLGLTLRPDQIDGGLGADRRELVETRTSGWTLTGIGGAALITGAALLGVGLARHKRAKTGERKASALLLTPWASSGRAGLGVVGRF